MNSHNPFDTGGSGCTNDFRSADQLVDRIIGDAYHVVKEVYLALGNLTYIYNYLQKYGLIITVDSEDAIKDIPLSIGKFARVYNKSDSAGYYFTDYLYVADDTTGIPSNDPTATGSWISTKATGSNASFVRIWKYHAVADGETVIQLPTDMPIVGVQTIYVQGSRQDVDEGFTYNEGDATITLADELEAGNLVTAIIGITDPDMDIDIFAILKNSDGASNIGTSAGITVEDALTNSHTNAREQWRRQLADIGLSLVEGSFEQGAVVSTATDAVWHIAGGQCYVWGGAVFPQTIMKNSNPSSAGGISPTAWVSISDRSLQARLASNALGLGSDTIGSTVDTATVGDIIRAPAIITGRVNIRNPYWNAPRDNAEDPAAAAANVEAINRMLASGAKNVELDDKGRRVNAPLIYQGSVAIHGAGRSVASLIWQGGDLPVFARPNYTDKDAAGFSNVRLQDLRITDQAATRTSYYTVDLFNGNSNGLERCWIDCPGRYDSSNNRIITADRYGVALGLARNSNLAGSNGFVSHMRDSRITNGTLIINGTDWYVTGSELWGSFRTRAVEISGGGTIDGGTQIVPGQEAGIFLFSDVGYDIDTLKLIGVYFDGSTDTTLFTGWGIKSAAGIGLVSAEILGCDFWHMNQGGILAAKLYSSTIKSNFRDCDSDDTGEDDIKCDDVYGSHIYNRHFRNTAPKNGDAARVNLGKPYSITAKSGFPISSLGGEVSFSNSYSRCSVVNPTYARSLGGSYLSSFAYGALPNAQARHGEHIIVGQKSYYSDGSAWRDLTRDPIVLSTATDLHLLPYSHNYFASDITIHSNIPAGVTGAAKIEYEWASAGYSTITLTLLKTSGGVYSQIQSGGVWGTWNKVA